MAEGLVQRLYLFVAPVLFGSRGGEAFDGLTLDEPATWRVVRRGAFGPDTMIELERS
jgi:riboflavin biosynthesis pyrimidine reductase